MLLYRWLKRTAYMNRKTRQYVGYAIGEILLVIVGILIALQIDNWNTERKDRATLDNYLHAIARNMRDDIDQLERLHALRSDSVNRSRVASTYLLARPSYRIEHVEYLAAALRVAADTRYFNANTSSFDALKNSGVLDNLQGMDAEELLSRYYVRINSVRQLEQDYAAAVKAALVLPRGTVRDDYEGFAIRDPQALHPGRFEELQPFYSDFFRSEFPRGLLSTASNAPAILREYDTLLSLARLFIDTVENGSGKFDDGARQALAELDALEARAGFGDVIRNGELAVGYFDVIFGFPYYLDGELAQMDRYVDYQSIRTEGDGFSFSQQGGLPWAAFALIMRERPGTLGRAAADFSRFERIVLEAKGAKGGERLRVHMKDAEDPDDGSQTDIEIVLGKDWQTWEFELSDFETADPSKLHLVLGFLMLEQQEPISFSVRTISFR